jgi:hypothetical protein
MTPTISPHWSRLFLAALASVLLLSCAGQIPPPGGPVDVVPPEVTRTVPDTNAVHVTENQIELEFSKYVDRRSVEESIFISPYVGDLEYDWGGTNVTVKFSQPLRQATTYVVNVGTDVRDVRAGNRMARGFTLAFTTGDSIDRGSISGRVVDDKPEGVMIFAYALGEINPDTLNPTHTRPEYIMQTGKGGYYSLSHLSYNKYRVLAVRDQYRDLIYDKQTDQYGVATGDIELTQQNPAIGGVNFRLSEEDTTRPFLTAVRALDGRRLAVGFNEPLDSLSFSKASFVVLDTLSGVRLPVALSYLNPGTPSSVGITMAVRPDSGKSYRLITRNVTDRAGNLIDTLHASGDFVGGGIPDTVKPRVTASVRDSIKGVFPDVPLQLIFSEPVDTLALAHAVSVRDAAKKPIDVDLHWLSAVELLVRPRAEFAFNAWYRLQVVMDSVRDLEGNAYKDSTLALRFQTLDLRTTGTIEGTVTDAVNAVGRVVVTAARADATDVRRRTVTLPAPGPFKLDRLPEGMYGISSFRDADSSGTYGYGLPFPYKPSERFAVYQDPVKVRARWGVQGVVIPLK